MYRENQKTWEQEDDILVSIKCTLKQNIKLSFVKIQDYQKNVVPYSTSKIINDSEASTPNDLTNSF